MSEENKNQEISDELKKKLSEIPSNTPEHYARYYMMPEGDVEFFEKIREFHYYCQAHDIPVMIFSVFKECGEPATFYHLTAEVDNQTKAHKAFDWLVSSIGSFVKMMTRGAVKVIREY